MYELIQYTTLATYNAREEKTQKRVSPPKPIFSPSLPPPPTHTPPNLYTFVPSSRKHPSSVHTTRHLCLPDLLNTLGDTNIVRLKLIKTVEDDGGSDVQCPGRGLVEAAPLALGEVVGDTGPISSCQHTIPLVLIPPLLPHCRSPSSSQIIGQ